MALEVSHEEEDREEKYAQYQAPGLERLEAARRITAGFEKVMEDAHIFLKEGRQMGDIKYQLNGGEIDQRKTTGYWNLIDYFSGHLRPIFPDTGLTSRGLGKLLSEAEEGLLGHLTKNEKVRAA